MTESAPQSTEVAQTWPSLANECGRNRGPDSAEVAKSWPIPSRARANRGRNRAAFRRPSSCLNEAKFDRHRPIWASQGGSWCRIRTLIRPKSPNLGRCQPSNGRNQPGSADIAQSWLDFGQCWNPANIAQCWPNSSQFRSKPTKLKTSSPKRRPHNFQRARLPTQREAVQVPGPSTISKPPPVYTRETPRMPRPMANVRAAMTRAPWPTGPRDTSGTSKRG